MWLELFKILREVKKTSACLLKPNNWTEGLVLLFMVVFLCYMYKKSVAGLNETSKAICR
jgi:hypothetical protein